jgi:hypothetical protein
MKPESLADNGLSFGGPRPRRVNPVEAMRQIAAIRLRELRQAGMTHDEIAGMFGLTPGRIRHLCGELCGEDPGEYGLDFG